MKKERIDILCVEQGLFTSREKAKRAIMAGIVRTDNEYIDKPGTKIPRDTKLYVKGEQLRYVSRGGLKLEKAIAAFEINLQNQIMLDIGSSTGGFTDCALQNGASLVYAVDVGTNQLVWKLRSDERVIVMEKTNFRYATPEQFPQIPDFATIDVSFISLSLILPPLSHILKKNGYVMALIKPQFEAGRDEVGKNGIVREFKTHIKVIEKVIAYANENGFSLKGLTYSPITGGEGNIEFLAYFCLDHGENKHCNYNDIVEEAHHHFRKG